MRISQGHNLPAIRRIGEDFLVAGDGGIEDHLAHRETLGADRSPAKDGAIFKHQDGRDP
jgi:hypothetical protein